MNINFSGMAKFSWWRFILFLLTCVAITFIWKLPDILIALGFAQ